MIKDFNGSANNPEIFKYLVGETIRGVFKDKESLYIVVGSGDAFVFSGNSYWKESAKDVKAKVNAIRDTIVKWQNELNNLNAIEELIKQ